MLRDLTSLDQLTHAFGPIVAAASASSAVDLDDDCVQTILALRSRQFSNDQLRTLERHASEIFATLGLDLETPGTRDTPRRFIRALIDATAGYDGDPKLQTAFPTECHGGSECCRLNQIIEGPIQFFSLCEHHVLPFYGQAYIGYIAHQSGAYTACTYIAPFVEDITGLSGQSVAGVLLLIGVTSSVGNVVGGLGTDRVGPPRMLLASCVTLAASLAAFSVFGGWAPGILVAVGMWGLAMGVFVPTQQSRLVALAPAGVDVGLALNLSALSVGMALGAAVGGAVIEYGGIASLGHVGAAIITLALAGLVRQGARSDAEPSLRLTA